MAKKAATSKNNLPRVYTEVLQSVGLFMQYWGFKEVHGQVWTCIFLAEEPIDANRIIDQLKLSKAAISLAIKDLSDYKVINEVEKLKPSTRKYVTNPDLADVIMNVLRFREKKMLALVVNACRSLAQTNGDELSKLRISPERAQALTAMSEGAQLILDQVLLQSDVDMSQMFSLLHVDNP